MTANPILEPIAPIKGAAVPAWAAFLNNWMLSAGRRITEATPLLMSSEFASLIDAPTRSLGNFEFKGVSGARAVSAPVGANIEALS